MQTQQSLKVFVKGDPTTRKLADCPFCHRVLLTLDTKEIPYDVDYIDFANKPDWLQEKAAGKVPVIQEGDTWTPDSDKIVEHLEALYPEPSMKSSVPSDLGSKLFPSFRQLLMSTPEEAEDKKAALHQELKQLNDFLASNGPLFGGDNLNATDAAVAPKLYHATVALKHFKGWELPADLPAISKYMDTISQLPQWKKNDYGAAAIIKGWEAHGAAKQ